MKISQFYSHLNGWEHLQVHKKKLWQELESVVNGVDAEKCRTKKSKEAKKQKLGLLYSPKDMNRAFAKALAAFKWKEDRISYWVTSDAELIRKTITSSRAEQKKAIEDAGLTPISSYNQTDFSKERVHVEVQFGKYSFVAYDLFVKHMAFFVGSKIDVGIEILPMKSFQDKMSSGVPYYKAELYNLIRQGRSTPAVPLVVVGIAP
ncbi:MAG: BglII/BstYI family type II restriction endonuclease [Gemmatimonadaceae bacterium]